MTNTDFSTDVARGPGRVTPEHPAIVAAVRRKARRTVHYLTVAVSATGDYSWDCACGAESSGAWRGDKALAVRGAIVDGREAGHRGGIAFLGFTMTYREAEVATRP
jgi:hypothetical protein